MVFAQPTVEGQDSGYIFEGDRFGGVMRTATNVAPIASTNIMATNHFWKYKMKDGPTVCNDVPTSFSSLWRYEVGKNMLEAFAHTESAVGTAEVKRLLQTVSHASTEHSIIWRPNQMTFDVAIADTKSDRWYAPYLGWETFKFNDVFFGHSTSAKTELRGNISYIQ
eukprot:GFYU01000941.1.p1 GENE.GFYU01000941.1~~GFYU01000941.1.p1  ORF type:complete len:179 (-),score=58.67 GFYU01000941.1:215-712(-)